MSTITDEASFKTALHTLSLQQQRLLASLFIQEAVSRLCQDHRVLNSLHTLQTPAVNDEMISSAYKAVKSAGVDSFTRCGNETDWLGQAAHFIALACAAGLTPNDQVKSSDNLAWNAAMYARMAKTFETIAAEGNSDSNEPQRQYKILEDFINSPKL